MEKKQGKSGLAGDASGRTPKRVALVTLGCKVNQYESAGLAERIRQLGHTLVGFDSEADVCIINTCTVTARTDFQSRQLVRRAARRNPDAPVIVTGCYAQIAADRLKTLPGVRIIAGNTEKEMIPGLLGALNGGPVDVFMKDIGKIRRFSGLAPEHFPGRTRAYLKIQDGCNARCSYCIVPKARGGNRSMPEEDAIRRAGAIASKGYREIVLTGIHLGAWGQDLRPARDLARLVRRIDREVRIDRLRLSSVEPLEVTPDLIDCLREAKALCPHLHIPLQSGDDRVLAAMGRHYNAKFFSDLVSRLVAEIPSLAVGVDVMAGFPGESEKEFENTVSLLRDLPVAYLHVFPYSDRPTTKASALPDKVGEAEKKRRAAVLRSLGLAKRQAFAGRFIGTTQAVLVEESRDRKTGCLKGFTGPYIPVLLQGGGKEMTNRIIDVRIESVDAGIARGRISHEP